MNDIEKRLAWLESAFLILADYLMIKKGDIEINEENKEVVNFLLTWANKANDLKGFINNIKED